MPNMLVMFKVKGQYGRLIGNFTSVKDVQGTVYAVNDEILFIHHLPFNGTQAGKSKLFTFDFDLLQSVE